VQSRDVASTPLGKPALLRLPDPGVETRGGVVALHGASLPQRDQPLFEHLAITLTPMGFAVLSFDRRPGRNAEEDPAVDVQAEDALTAVELLRSTIDAPVGLFGYSQGAWSASLAASRDPSVTFLATLGCSGVSPAEQMRFYTDELLRRAGFDESGRARVRELRLAVEAILRGDGDRTAATALLRSAVDQPWFDLAYLDRELPTPDDAWPDMDYDPEPAFEKVTCPILLIFGADEECVPAAASEQVWRRATRTSGNQQLTVVTIPDCGHFPAPDVDASSRDVPIAAFSPAYTIALRRWFAEL
jgi:pimeloyl-ACP methyl ester carboxylesterase